LVLLLRKNHPRNICIFRFPERVLLGEAHFDELELLLSLREIKQNIEDLFEFLFQLLALHDFLLERVCRAVSRASII